MNNLTQCKLCITKKLTRSQVERRGPVEGSEGISKEFSAWSGVQTLLRPCSKLWHCRHCPRIVTFQSRFVKDQVSDGTLFTITVSVMVCIAWYEYWRRQWLKTICVMSCVRRMIMLERVFGWLSIEQTEMWGVRVEDFFLEILALSLLVFLFWRSWNVDWSGKSVVLLVC